MHWNHLIPSSCKHVAACEWKLYPLPHHVLLLHITIPSLYDALCGGHCYVPHWWSSFLLYHYLSNSIISGFHPLYMPHEQPLSFQALSDQHTGRYLLKYPPHGSNTHWPLFPIWDLMHCWDLSASSGNWDFFANIVILNEVMKFWVEIRVGRKRLMKKVPSGKSLICSGLVMPEFAHSVHT